MRGVLLQPRGTLAVPVPSTTMRRERLSDVKAVEAMEEGVNEVSDELFLRQSYKATAGNKHQNLYDTVVALAFGGFPLSWSLFDMGGAIRTRRPTFSHHC